MTAPSMVYCDPSIGGNTGAGTALNPYSGYRHALSTLSHDSTNGTQLNVKSGVAETLAGPVSLGFTPSLAAPLIIRGFNTVENDGGMAQIDGDATYQVAPFAGYSNIGIIDMDMGNCGNNNVLTFYHYSYMDNVRIHGSTKVGGYGAYLGLHCQILNSEISDIAGDGVYLTHYGCKVSGCDFRNGTNSFRYAVNCAYVEQLVDRNTFSIDGSTTAIYCGSVQSQRIQHNSILSNGGTGTAVLFNGANRLTSVVQGNLIEGFSGTGGTVFDAGISESHYIATIRNNSIFNCETAFKNFDGNFFDQQVGTTAAGNEILGSSPFQKSGANTYANRADYFAPADVGSVLGGAYVGA